MTVNFVPLIGIFKKGTTTFAIFFFTVDLEDKTVSPPNWKKKLWELDPKDEGNNGLINEDLIVWMRTAAFPNFRKLYRKIGVDLEKGTYKLKINYSK